MRSRIALVGVALAVVGCATSGGAGGGAVRSVPLGVDDRIVVRSSADVFSVSTTTRYVYALTSGGLITYDRTFARWKPISARSEEDLQLVNIDRARLPIMRADVIDDAVWIGINGAVLRYRAQLDQVERFSVPGQVSALRLARDGAYVNASGQWFSVSRGGFVSPIAGGTGGVALAFEPDLDAVYQAHPSLRGQLEFLLRDSRAAGAGGGLFPRVIAGTLSPDRTGEIWIGTLGDGLWTVDANFLQATPLRYGVLDDAIGALTITADGVISAGQGTRRGAGISVVHRDLQLFRWITSPSSAPLDGAYATALATRGANVWVATDRGVVRVRVGETPAFTQWTALHGLPAEQALSVVALDDGAWVGTTRGLVFIHDSSNNAAVRGNVTLAGFPGEPVHTLMRVRDQLLVGTARGLFTLKVSGREDASQNTAPQRLLGRNAMFVRPIQAAAWSDSTLLLVTDRRAHLLSLERTLQSAYDSVASSQSDSVWSEFELQTIAPVHSAAMDARSLWIAGRNGVLTYSRLSGATRMLRAGVDVPARVTAVALDDSWAWIGTDRGIVRVKRASDGGLP